MVEKDKRKKILVIGAGGLLGTEVVRILSRGPFDVKGVVHAELDITQGKEVSIWLERLHPDIIINCAALSNVDGCETYPQQAFKVNAEGVKNICLPLLEDVRARLIHISTDYVFDGKKEAPYVETDAVNPLSYYAESKLKGEEYVRKLLADAIVLRVQWLYGERGTSFASRVVQEVTQGNYPATYRFIKDRVGDPTSVTEIARGMEALILKGDDVQGGIYHLSAQGACSWVEFGKAIFEINGIDRGDRHIQVTQEREMKRAAKRPRYSSFSSERFFKATGFKMSHWQGQLKDVILNLRGGSIS